MHTAWTAQVFALLYPCRRRGVWVYSCVEQRFQVIMGKMVPSVAEMPDSSSEDETSRCKITHLALCSSRLDQEGMSGSIDGVMYTAASTLGDGACGLHALFGVPQGQRLCADNVRPRVLEALPSDLASLCGALCGDVRDYLNWMLDSIWEEAKTGACHLVQMQEPRNESSSAFCFLGIGRFSALWKPDAATKKRSCAASPG